MSSISKPVLPLHHEHHHSSRALPCCHHLHRRRPLRPRAAASDQHPGPPRTPPARRRHRPLGRDRCPQTLPAAWLLQPVRLRGARARLQRRRRGAAHRRRAAVRRPAGRARAAARRLADAERRSGAAVGVRPAAAERAHLRHRVACAGGLSAGERCGRGFRRTYRRVRRRPGLRRRTVRRPIPRRPGPQFLPLRRRWCSMRREGRNWWRTRPARARAKSAGCWPTWTRSWRRRPTGCARSATAATS